jgi:hypothetical protein
VQPSWNISPSSIFDGVSANGTITVTGGWDADAALIFLQGFKLPSTWTVGPQ